MFTSADQYKQVSQQLESDVKTAIEFPELEGKRSGFCSESAGARRCLLGG